MEKIISENEIKKIFYTDETKKKIEHIEIFEPINGKQIKYIKYSHNGKIINYIRKLGYYDNGMLKIRTYYNSDQTLLALQVYDKYGKLIININL